jgi:peptide deformylase
VASPTFETDDRRVYINPRIVSLDGNQDGEEGCLSFPGISSRIKRANLATIQALDADGEQFEETAEGLLARIYQHESDHLDGRLLVDRMGSVGKLANRRALKNLEEDFAGR